MPTLFRVFSFPLAYSVKDFQHPPLLSCAIKPPFCAMEIRIGKPPACFHHTSDLAGRQYFSVMCRK